MPRQNLYGKDERSQTTSIRVDLLLYNAVLQRGGNVEDILETALSAYLHVPSEILRRLHEEQELLEHCYIRISAKGVMLFLQRSLHDRRGNIRSSQRWKQPGGRCLRRYMRRWIRFRSRDDDTSRWILRQVGSAYMRRSW